MTAETNAPAPSPAATFATIIGLLAGYLFLDGETPSLLARSAAWSIGLSLLVGAMVDYRGNLRNLVRTDIMALASLYFLTLFEFLLPQPGFDLMIGLEPTAAALPLCFLAFGGLVIGRHWAPAFSGRMKATLQHEFPPRLLMSLFWVSIIGGYFYQFAAVDFDVGLWFDYSMAPRFSQPWGRGRLGDWKALFGEFGMIINLAPPIAGIIFARRSDYGRKVLTLVGAGLALTLFTAFVGGTRNVLATYLATFTVAYAFSLSHERRRELLIVGCSSAATLLICTVVMLEFRNIGFQRYLDGYRAGEIDTGAQTVFVDYNLYVMAELTEVFPERHGYLGLEIPILAVIRPIPRALWPGKPEGMSIGIEEALGASGLTLASSFIGEAYISGGTFGVLATALVFGLLFGWWNRLGSADNSPFGHLVFASGFFAAVISMRSMLVFTTAILPTIAAIVLGSWLLRRQPVRRVLQYHDDVETEN
ncbi:MAG: O-antigen polymerase [Verrucomicrobiota bacterium]